MNGTIDVLAWRETGNDEFYAIIRGVPKDKTHDL